MKARTVPGRMAWVNGRGYQRACSYRHIAAVAEMLVAFSLNKARQAVVLVMSALTSRTAGYGPVCMDQAAFADQIVLWLFRECR